MAVETATESRASFPSRVARYYHDVMAEMRRVTWPDRGQVKNATVGIIIFVLVVGAVISLMDLVLQTVLVRAIPSLFTGN